MTVMSPSCHTAAPGQGVRLREHFRKEPSHKQPFLLLLHPTATPWSPAPPPGVAPLLLVTSGHVSLHNYGTPLESAAGHREPDARLWPTQPPLLLFHPIWGRRWVPEPVPREVDTHPPKAEAGTGPSEQGPLPLHFSGAALPIHPTLGLRAAPLHRSNNKGKMRAEPSLSWF